MEVDNPASGENYLPRVNAGMLGNYIDKNVLIVAEFLSVSSFFNIKDKYDSRKCSKLILFLLFFLKNKNEDQ